MQRLAILPSLVVGYSKKPVDSSLIFHFIHGMSPTCKLVIHSSDRYRLDFNFFFEGLVNHSNTFFSGTTGFGLGQTGSGLFGGEF